MRGCLQQNLTRLIIDKGLLKQQEKPRSPKITVSTGTAVARSLCGISVVWNFLSNILLLSLID